MTIENAHEGLTIAAAAKRIGVHYQTMRNWIKAGSLPVTRFGPSGGIVRIDPEDLARLSGGRDVGTVSFGGFELPAPFGDDVRSLCENLDLAHRCQANGLLEPSAETLHTAAQKALAIARMAEHYAARARKLAEDGQAAAAVGLAQSLSTTKERKSA